MQDYFRRRGFDVRRHRWMFLAGLSFGMFLSILVNIAAYFTVSAVLGKGC